MTQHSIRSFAIVAAAAVLFSTNAIAQDGDYDSSWQSIPAKAFAFVHVDLEAIADSPSMTIPRDIVMGVKEELDQVFESNIGIKVTEVMDATLVIPSAEAALATADGETAPGFILLSFNSSVSIQRIRKALGGGWSLVSAKGGQMLVDEKKERAIFHHSANTLALGSQDQVQWFINNRDDDEYSPLDDAMTESEYGQVIFGIDGRKIPAELTRELPPEFRFVEKMNFASVSLDLIGGITVDSVFEFASVEDAKEVSKLANVQLKELRSMIGLLESDAMRRLVTAGKDLDQAVEPLAELALYRYGKKLANETEVQHFRNRVMTHVGIEGVDGTLFLAGIIPTMIGASGEAAEAAFDDIASQLDAE